MKILDCTLRDGGYYTKWDFDENLVEKYIDTMNNLPIDYIEVGYRSPAKKEYMGKFYYTPIETIEKIRNKLSSRIKIAIMINTKDIVSPQELRTLLVECKGKIDLVRFAVAPSNIKDAVSYAIEAKKLGFEIALNLMYLSKNNLNEIINVIDYIIKNISNIDYIYLVDSYGACFPSEVKDKFITIREKYKELQIGFHGHDNIQLAYANSLEAISAGACIIDATITGMGRGAGNLSTELICSYKAAKLNIDLDYTNLIELVELINELKIEHGWGTSLPYMISGFNNLPQGEVMDLISLKRFSTDNIVKKIKNKIHKDVVGNTNMKFQELKQTTFANGYDFAIIVGGGTSVLNHFEGLKTLNSKYKILFIHSTTKHLNLFLEETFNNLICLPGEEVKKIRSIDWKKNNLKFVFSNETYIDKDLVDSNFYLIGNSSIDTILDDKIIVKDAPLYMALKVTEILNITSLYIIGFDGYEKETQANKVLKQENQVIIDTYSKLRKNLISLTPSNYNINVSSMYSLIVHGIEK